MICLLQKLLLFWVIQLHLFLFFNNYTNLFLGVFFKAVKSSSSRQGFFFGLLLIIFSRVFLNLIIFIKFLCLCKLIFGRSTLIVGENCTLGIKKTGCLNDVVSQ